MLELIVITNFHWVSLSRFFGHFMAIHLLRKAIDISDCADIMFTIEVYDEQIQISEKDAPRAPL